MVEDPKVSLSVVGAIEISEVDQVLRDSIGAYETVIVIGKDAEGDVEILHSTDIVAELWVMAEFCKQQILEEVGSLED